MPELPEVETTLKGIEPYVLNQKIQNVTIRHFGMRWPIPPTLAKSLVNQTIYSITRRGKYLLFSLKSGTLIIHLGMSGSMRVVDIGLKARKHDHVDIDFNNKKTLRFTDPRRFGAILWTTANPLLHPLLAHLGPEPLQKNFNATYLQQLASTRKAPVKSFIMDSKIVVGVGNIYATESLYTAKIHPMRPAASLSFKEWQTLAREIKKVLKSAIKQGGTTLKDFVHSDGQKGYFRISLKAYGRKGQACLRCGEILEEIRLAQRSTVYCPICQVSPRMAAQH